MNRNFPNIIVIDAEGNRLSPMKHQRGNGKFPNIIVVDAEGNRLSPTRNHSKHPTTTAGTKSPMKCYAELEDAIFNSPPFRKTFLEITRALAEEEDLSRFAALKHCWNVLNWRPDPNGKRVYTINPSNPYQKNK